MLLLFETSVGFAIFKVKDDKKLAKIDTLYEEFSSPTKASKLVKLEHFEKFKDATEALTSVTSLVEGKLSKKLKKALKNISSTSPGDVLGVADPKLGTAIKDKFAIDCQATEAVQRLMSCVRGQLPSLVPEWSHQEEAAMQLAISHGLGRYKLKFSPDKVDTMIVQAISLLDDLDKELNNYIMRCKEWYGWHFPELIKLIPDQTAFIKVILKMGMKTNAASIDFSDILPTEVESKVKETAEVSMGSEISEEDLLNIQALGKEVLELQSYREHLYEYLKRRMMAIAPNLTILVGEIVGARLISHAGSLVNLAKHPASTVQILGAEKALFRAIKTRQATPKYGLIYHAQLVGQSNPKIKGKMSRMLAAKASLATRVDALGEGDASNNLGIEHRQRLESRLKFLEEGGIRRISGTGKGKAKMEKYQHKSTVHQYKPASDSTIKEEPADEPMEEVKVEASEEADAGVEAETPSRKRKKDKKKKKLIEEVKTEEDVEPAEQVEDAEEAEAEPEPEVPKKKKKKGKNRDTSDE